MIFFVAGSTRMMGDWRFRPQPPDDRGEPTTATQSAFTGSGDPPRRDGPLGCRRNWGRANMRRLAAAFALAGIAILIAACSRPNQKPPTPPAASPAGPPRIAVADLGGLLLSPGDINIAMGTTGMAVAAAVNEMRNDGAEMADNDCRFADGPAEASVYAGSGWTAVRGGVVQQPGNVTDSVGLAVVSFPSADDATAFFTASAERWPPAPTANTPFARPANPTWCGPWGRSPTPTAR